VLPALALTGGRVMFDSEGARINSRLIVVKVDRAGVGNAGIWNPRQPNSPLSSHRKLAPKVTPKRNSCFK